MVWCLVTKVSDGMAVCIPVVCIGVACGLGCFGSWYVLSESRVVGLSGDVGFGDDVD